MNKKKAEEKSVQEILDDEELKRLRREEAAGYWGQKPEETDENDEQLKD